MCDTSTIKKLDPIGSYAGIKTHETVIGARDALRGPQPKVTSQSELDAAAEAERIKAEQEATSRANEIIVGDARRRRAQRGLLALGQSLTTGAGRGTTGAGGGSTREQSGQRTGATTAVGTASSTPSLLSSGATSTARVRNPRPNVMQP